MDIPGAAATKAGSDRDILLAPGGERQGNLAEAPSRVSQSTFPFLTSTALKCRSRSPTNASLPAVESTAVKNGARCSIDHVSFMVSTSKAESLADVAVASGIPAMTVRSPAA